MNEYKFIVKCILPALDKHGVQLHLDFNNNHVITDELPCSGYFDDRRKVLACAVGTKNVEDWFGTLLHEFSHFEQYTEQCEAWTNSQPTDCNSDELLDRFLKGENFDNMDSHIKSVAYLEYDCEKRTVKKLNLFPEIFNVEEYIQKSNAYVAFYKHMYSRRQWYSPAKAPYLNLEIWSKLPSEFLDFEAYFDDSFDYINWNLCFESESCNKEICEDKENEHIIP